MKTEMSNKAVKTIQIKDIKETKTQANIKVFLKNTTSIKGKLFQAGENTLTQEEYDLVKMFL